jgi:beta-galactosidase
LSGYIGRTGFRKTSSWDVQSFFSEKPMVHLAILDIRPENLVSWVWNEVKITNRENLSHWNWKGLSNINVESYSNCEEVELFLNGKSLGVKKSQGEPGTGPRLQWNIQYFPGTLLAVGRNGGKEVSRHEINTAGSPASLRLIPDKREISADGQDLSHIRVEVTDARGIVVPGANNLVKFEVAGAGTIAGVDNDDPITEEFFQSNQRTVFRGVALLVVRSEQTPGKIIVRASAKGLKSAVIELESLKQ